MEKEKKEKALVIILAIFDREHGMYTDAVTADTGQAAEKAFRNMAGSVLHMAKKALDEHDVEPWDDGWDEAVTSFIANHAKEDRWGRTLDYNDGLTYYQVRMAYA